jgi:hypothetical protein
MEWQEYQNAVGELYVEMEGIGNVRKNITIPDKVTGQPRQIDVWLELEAKGHKIGILVDAKFRRDKIDVTDVDATLSLGESVGASKCVIVASNGWTGPAEKKAKFAGMDLKLLSIDQALDLIVEDKWLMCPICEDDCIVLDRDGATNLAGSLLWYLAGRCRECGAAMVWCQDCGDKI